MPHAGTVAVCAAETISSLRRAMQFCVALLPDGLGECLATAGYELRGDAGTLGTGKKLECNHLTVAAHDCYRLCTWVVGTG